MFVSFFPLYFFVFLLVGFFLFFFCVFFFFLGGGFVWGRSVLSGAFGSQKV